MNTIVIKTQFLHKIKYDLKGYFYIIERFCDLFLSDLITSYFIKDNFCPCFYFVSLQNLVTTGLRFFKLYCI